MEYIETPQFDKNKLITFLETLRDNCLSVEIEICQINDNTNDNFLLVENIECEKIKRIYKYYEHTSSFDNLLNFINKCYEISDKSFGPKYMSNNKIVLERKISIGEIHFELKNPIYYEFKLLSPNMASIMCDMIGNSMYEELYSNLIKLVGNNIYIGKFY